jgi:hypothetical protein
MDRRIESGDDRTKEAGNSPLIWCRGALCAILLLMDGSHLKLARLRSGRRPMVDGSGATRAPFRHGVAASSPPLFSELNSGS